MNEAQIAFAPQWATRFAPLMTSGPHAQHAATLLVGFDADVVVEAPGGAVRGGAVLVAPDLLHRAHCPGPSLAVLFDPEGTNARARWPAVLARVEGKGGRRLGEALRSHRARLDRPEVALALAAEFAQMLGVGPPLRRDWRVEAAIARLRAGDGDGDGGDGDGRGIESCARALALSPAHLRALFASQVGVSPKRYRLWSRLVRALRGVNAGGRRVTLTRAAVDAGFADAGHFSRTASALLGYPPSSLLGAPATR